jgi:hypothetical protein
LQGFLAGGEQAVVMLPLHISQRTLGSPVKCFFDETEHARSMYLA